MIRTLITIIILSFVTAWFLWSQLHWHYLRTRNEVLENRLVFFTVACKETVIQNKKLNAKNAYLAQQVYIFEHKRPRRRKYLAELKKLMKERNIEYGIGSN